MKMLWLAGLLAAQPVAAESELVIRGGKIYTLAGEAIENGVVLIRDGKIAAVGSNLPIPASAKVIEASGLQVYPGLFDSFSSVGLTEIGSIPATVDSGELGRFNPHLVAAAAVHPSSEHIPVVRANGITHAVAAPSGGAGGSVIPGQGTLLNLSGWTVEEMAVSKSVAMILNWPSLQTRSFDFATFSVRQRPFGEVKKEYEERLGELDDWIEAARHYAQAVEKGASASVKRDLRLEALARVVQGELPLVIRANDDRDIRNAVEFADRNRLKMILAGAEQAWKLKDLLRDKQIPVILGPTLTLPREEDEPYDKPNTRAAELQAAGIKIAFATLASSGPSPVPSFGLPYEAANAVGYGLPWEEALKAVTRYPAEILGVGDRLGTIEPGKLANLIVTDGDPLEIRTQIREVIIKGERVDTANKQRRLYETYRGRP